MHSYAGAIWLTLAALAAEQEVVVSRAEVGDVEPGCSLAPLAASAAAGSRRSRHRESHLGGRLRSGRHADRPPRSCDICRTPTASSARRKSAELDELVGLARDRELPLVDALGAAPLVDDLPALGDAMPLGARPASPPGPTWCSSAATDWWAVRAAASSSALANSSHRIETHPLFAAWRLDPLAAAALAATLELYDDPQQLRQTIPLFQLLSTSVENLRQRAERLAPQLAQAADVESAEAVATENLPRHRALRGPTNCRRTASR